MLIQLRHRLRQWLCPTSTPPSREAAVLARLEFRVKTVEDEIRDLRDTPAPSPHGVDMDAHLGAN